MMKHSNMILRRGTAGLTPAQFKDLLDNSDKVQAITGLSSSRAPFRRTA